MPTPTTSLRFTEKDLQAIATVREVHNISSMIGAIRFALQLAQHSSQIQATLEPIVCYLAMKEGKSPQELADELNALSRSHTEEA